MRTYQKNSHPGQADIVETYGTLEGIAALWHALGVVDIPVDTRQVGRPVQSVGNGRVVAQHVSFPVVRQVLAGMHPIVIRPGADVVLILLDVLVV